MINYSYTHKHYLLLEDRSVVVDVSEADDDSGVGEAVALLRPRPHANLHLGMAHILRPHLKGGFIQEKMWKGRILYYNSVPNGQMWTREW